MFQRVLHLTALMLVLAGCTLNSTPSGRHPAVTDGGPSLDAGPNTNDANITPGIDAGHPQPGIDAGHRDGGPGHGDSGHTDAAVDAGPPPVAPPLLVFHFAGGGTGRSGKYMLRHSVGALRPTHSPTVPTGTSSSEHYRLSSGLLKPGP